MTHPVIRAGDCELMATLCFIEDLPCSGEEDESSKISMSLNI
jgi:hypothetical protein